MKLYEILDGHRKEKNFSCIYLWTNLDNGKHYVGQTQNFYNRMKQYEFTHGNIYLQHSIEKHGIDRFDITVLEYVDVEFLDEREQYWIDYYESYNPELGYNICRYASSTRGYHHTEETKKLLSEINLGKPGFVGEDNPMYGKHWSEYQHEKRREYLKEKWSEPEYRKRQSERMSAKNNYFYDKHLTGEQNGMYGKHHSEETKKFLHDKFLGVLPPTCKRIVCIETGGEFESMTAAARWLHTYASAIKIAVDNPKRTCRGYHFRLVENT